MKKLMIGLSLFSISAFAEVPHNAECIVKKGAIKCSASVNSNNGQWDASVNAGCYQPVSFRLSDKTVVRTTIEGGHSTTSSFEVDILTLGLNSVFMKSAATSASKKNIKYQLELFENCSKYDR